MPERPLLVLPSPQTVEPRSGTPHPPPKLALISRDRQGQRIGPKFLRLQSALSDPDELARLQRDSSSIAPERAIVLEVGGQVEDFYRLVNRIPGLEYLAEDETQFEPDEDFYWENKPDKLVTGRLYLAMPDLRALQELVSLWNRYQREEPFSHGLTRWRKIFEHLKDVRPWSPQDRIPQETKDYWLDRLARYPEQAVRFEVEMWFRDDEANRLRAAQRLRQAVTTAKGKLVHEAVIQEIRYHAALIDLPAGEIRHLIQDPTIGLGRVDDVMYLQPQSIAGFPVEKEKEAEGKPETGGDLTPPASLPPICALFDGFPVQNHVLLAGRLNIDDPDDIESNNPVDRRKHGTAMASLILHGDRELDEPSLSRRLYVRPLLQYMQREEEERTPSDRLLIDTIYRAVLRIKKGENGDLATGPEVLIVNLSLGDPRRPYSGLISPWARLVDYLSYTYNLLFIISAGNVGRALPLLDCDSLVAFEDANPQEREATILHALNANKAERTLLSPSEALNAITVGSWHSDGLTPPDGASMIIDPFPNGGLPNVSSALGLGHLMSVKPEIHLDGGRELLRPQIQDGHIVVSPARAYRWYGQTAAAPGRRGELDHTERSSGTSNATALATRAAHRIYDMLRDADGGSLHTDIELSFYPVILKTLLVHGAQWGERGEFLETLFGPHGRGTHNERRDNVARFLGYGHPQIERVLDCTAQRATLLGCAIIAPEQSQMYQIPLPAGLQGVTELRRVTLTTAWLSPINPRHQVYRAAALNIEPGRDKAYSLEVKRIPHQPTDKAIRRGTVIHEILEGDKAAAFVDGGEMFLQVTCKASAGRIDENIPYALAVSLEVGVESTIPIYDEVRAAIMPRARAPVS